MDNKTFQNLVNEEKDTFHKRYNTAISANKFILVDDIIEATARYYNTTIQSMPNKNEPQPNGRILFPDYTYASPIVVISKQVMEDQNKTFYSTIFHELTHLEDFASLVSFKNATKYKDIGVTYFDAFYFWTEYHAKYNGYCRWREAVYEKDNCSMKELLEFTKVKELSYQIDNLKECLLDCKDKPYMYLYNIMQYFGRLSAIWDIYIRELLPFDYIEQINPKLSKELFNLFVFLRAIQNFNVAIFHLSDLDSLLKGVCPTYAPNFKNY